MVKDWSSIKRVLDRYGVIITVTSLPYGCRGSVKKHGYGYAIAINEQLSPTAAYKTLCHELLHIVLGHLDACKELSEDEKEAQVDDCLSSWALSLEGG